MSNELKILKAIEERGDLSVKELSNHFGKSLSFFYYALKNLEIKKEIERVGQVGNRRIYLTEIGKQRLKLEKMRE